MALLTLTRSCCFGVLSHLFILLSSAEINSGVRMWEGVRPGSSSPELEFIVCLSISCHACHQNSRQVIDRIVAKHEGHTCICFSRAVYQFCVVNTTIIQNIRARPMDRCRSLLLSCRNAPPLDVMVEVSLCFALVTFRLRSHEASMDSVLPGARVVNKSRYSRRLIIVLEFNRKHARHSNCMTTAFLNSRLQRRFKR